MAAILLPEVAIRSASVRVVDFGGYLTPGLGGVVQRINRLGNRYAYDVELPPLPEEPTGRLFTIALERALSEGAVFPIAQTGFKVGSPGAPVIDGAVAGGTALPLSGLTSHYAVRAGQYLSIIVAGRRYLHRSTVQGIADALGDVTLTIMPMLRAELAGGETVEIAKPMIEGMIDAPSWGLMLEPYASVNFSITERG